MRLTCPNCGAEYDVPEGVIPPAGKHVQCAACHTRWFRRGEAREELSEDQILRKLETRATRPVAPAGPPPAGPPPGGPRLVQVGEAVTPFAPREAAPEGEARGDIASGEPAEAEGAAPVEAIPPARAVPASALRPDARLDARPVAPREAAVPAAEPAETTVARVPAASTGETTGENRDPRPALREAPRLAPRIELDGAHAPTPPAPRRRGRFLPGFIVALLLAGLAFEVYVWREPLAAQIPAAAPAIHGYADTIDAAREWVGERVGARPKGQTPS